MMWLRNFGAGLVDVVFPPRCLTCGALADPFCDGCAASVVPVFHVPRPREVLEVRSAGLHEGPLREAVLKLKFHRKPVLAAPLGGLIAEAARPVIRSWRPDALVPVPIHWTRRLERGFNQSELLAEQAGRRLGLPVVPALRRLRPTPPQLGLSAAERSVNLRGAFGLVRGASLAGRRLVLIDDVTTTGATLSECAAALRGAGAAAVFAVTVSHGL